MNDNLYGIKELYDVYLKSTYFIDAGNRHIDEGEIILSFDNIQIGGLQEVKARTSARGGYDNREWVMWETTQELPLSFSQGIFSLNQLSLLSNSKIFEIQQGQPIQLTKRELLETDENSQVSLEFTPSERVFVYDKNSGEKINFRIDNNVITTGVPYQDIMVDYMYNYNNGGKIISIGNKLLSGYLSLEAKTRLKDDVDGHTVTGIIQIPKLKLMSDLSIRLGRNVDPAVVNFRGVGVPVGERGTSYVCNLIPLNDDIDSDI